MRDFVYVGQDLAINYYRQRCILERTPENTALIGNLLMPMLLRMDESSYPGKAALFPTGYNISGRGLVQQPLLRTNGLGTCWLILKASKTRKPNKTWMRTASGTSKVIQASETLMFPPERQAAAAPKPGPGFFSHKATKHNQLSKLVCASRSPRR